MRRGIDVMEKWLRFFFFFRYVPGKFSRLVFYLVSILMIRVLLLMYAPAA